MKTRRNRDCRQACRAKASESDLWPDVRSRVNKQAHPTRSLECAVSLSIAFIVMMFTEWSAIASFAQTAIPSPANANQSSPANSEKSTRSDGPIAEDEGDLSKLESLVKNGQFLESISSLRTYVLDHPASWRGRYDLGYALYRVRGGSSTLEENLRESIQELSKSLQLNLRNADAHKILGLDLTMIQRDELAEAEFKQAVALDPASAENHYLLGRHFMGKADYSRAIGELQTAIRLDPNYTKAYCNLGVSFDRWGNRPAALKNLKMAVELDEGGSGHSEQPYLELGRFYREANNLKDAQQMEESAVRLNPKSEDALIELAKIYRERGQPEQCLDALLRAKDLNPKSPQTYYLLGLTFHALGKEEASRRAFEDFDKLRQLEENSAPAQRTEAPTR